MLDYRIFLFISTLLTVANTRLPNEGDQAEPRKGYIIVCIHGEVIDGRCQCEVEYVGEFCEKKMHCSSYRRYTNGTCTGCVPGYMGEYCENIECVHGTLNARGTDCVCEAPFIGTFCTNLTTTRIYSYYNNKMYMVGPLGALSLVPMCFIYWWCERMAKKREVKRLSHQLGGQNIITTDGTLKYLLKNSV